MSREQSVDASIHTTINKTSFVFVSTVENGNEIIQFCGLLFFNCVCGTYRCQE